ncbi:MAG: zinc-ribbon domain-containing protein [Treponema sp.]|nr:zinc-ribbon domain-containing protein [Treponema sp.]
MNKNPRFFCDNCGAEVDLNAKACSQCGRFFASVRCPSCGFTGEERSFSRGCPSCGYSAPLRPPPATPIEKKVPAKPLPMWVYILSICAFIGICAVLYFRLF